MEKVTSRAELKILLLGSDSSLVTLQQCDKKQANIFFSLVKALTPWVYDYEGIF